MKRRRRKQQRQARTPPSEGAATPLSPSALVDRGAAAHRRHDHLGALADFRRALALDPENLDALAGLVGTLGGLRSRTPSPEIERALLAVYASAHANYDDIGAAAAAQLMLKYDPAAAAADPDAVADDPLFAAYLEKSVNANPSMERFLTGLRRRLLLAGPERLAQAALATAAALGRQCFANEYVFFAGDDERLALDALAERLNAALANGADAAEMRRPLLVYCLYRPLSALAESPRLAAADDGAFGPELARLVQLTLRDHAAEQALKSRLETLGKITDATSKKVRAQYEESPYPRWLHAPAQRPMPLPSLLARMFPGVSPPAPSDPLEVLIAGAGTGRQAVRVARTHPDARVTAVDLSKGSLAYAMRMTARLGIAGARFVHADILGLARLGRTFDMVQSVGVLHHMKNPLKGWRVLVALTRPGGIMKIGLYSDRGRRAVQACRRVIAEEKIAATPDAIAAFRRRLMDDPPKRLERADVAEIVRTFDFYSTSMCRDLLFHVQEHHWTPARLKRDLATLGLDFIGFEMFEQAGISAAYREAFPDDPALTDLDNWERFEAREGPLTDLYLLWCRKPAGR